MSDETGRRTGLKKIGEPLPAATGALGQDTAELYEFGPDRLLRAYRIGVKIAFSTDIVTEYKAKTAQK
jgi:hypothetical protein